MDVFYQQDNVFFLPPEARWSYVKARAKQDDIAVIIDTALSTIEKCNASLTGALPDNYFSRQGLEVKRLLLSLIPLITSTPRQRMRSTEEDLVGRVYEYFLAGLPPAKVGRWGVLYPESSGDLAC